MKKVEFYKNRKIYFIISLSLLTIGLIFNIIFGAKLDIEFAGGAIIHYAVDVELDQEDVKNTVVEITGRDAQVLTSTSIATGENQITVSFSGNESLSVDEQLGLASSLSDAYDGTKFEVIESSSVDPTMGAKFFQKALICLAITVVLLLIYISFRFRKIGGAAAGITAVIALVHDVLIIYFVFIVFRMSIDEIFIAVLLTILGYSLNDTIVIYDRIRENNLLFGNNKSPEEIMNISLNQTLMRSVLTSVTTFLALTVIYILAVIYGLSTVSGFALPMMVGVFCGCYSSLFIAAPIYTMWQKNKKQKPPKNTDTITDSEEAELQV